MKHEHRSSDDSFSVTESPRDTYDRRVRDRAAVLDVRGNGKPLSRPTRGFIAIAGVDRDTLAQCPWEAPKYVGLGITMLLSSALFAVSAYFMLTLGTGSSRALALAVSIAFGLMLLAVDRSLATVNPATGRRPRQRRATSLVPRFVLAVLLGIVMSQPLVVSVFGREIDAELAASDAFALAEAEAEAAKARFEVEDVQAQIAVLQAQYLAEVRGTTSGAPGDGPAARVITQQVEGLRLNEMELQVREASARQELAALEGYLRESHGVLDRLVALNSIQADEASIRLYVVSLSALMILISVAPVLSVYILNGNSDVYRELLANRETLLLDEARSSLARQRMQLELDALTTESVPPEPT